MRNETEGEKLLSNSRKEGRQLSGELRKMAYRMRAISRDVEGLTRDRWWEADASRAHFLSYCNTVVKLCADHAERIDRIDRLVIAKLQNLAQLARENDY